MTRNLRRRPRRSAATAPAAPKHISSYQVNDIVEVGNIFIYSRMQIIIYFLICDPWKTRSVGEKAINVKNISPP